MTPLQPMELECLHRDLGSLCGPEAAGRLSGTAGARRAAAYLGDALQAAGYRPAGAEGYDQPLDVVRDGEEVGAADLEGRVVLVPERPAGFDLAATAAAAAEAGVPAHRSVQLLRHTRRGGTEPGAGDRAGS